MAVTRIKNNQITDATIVASSKLQDYSVTSAKIANNLTYNSDLTIAGNLTVQGNVTTIETYDLVVEDPLILLAKDQAGSPSLDIGFIGKRGTSTNIAFVWKESAGQFETVFTSSETTNTTITVSSFASLQVLDITAANANITGNVTLSGNILGNVNVVGNVRAGNLNSNAAVTGVTITASGNLVGGNANITNAVNTATVAATGNVLAGNVNSNAAVTGVTITASGNLVGGNANITNAVNTATVAATGNVLAGNLNSNAAVTGVTITASGNLVGGNANITNGIYSATANITGNLTAGNISTSGTLSVASISATGNITGGNLISNAAVIGVTGSFSGNVLAANVNSNAAVTGVTITASGNLVGGNANITGAVNTATVSASGNVLAGNLNSNAAVTGVTVTASGNLVGGNANITNGIYSATLTTTGNALVGGNLVVMGNISYTNVDDLRVEDPVIILGTGPNGAPLTTDDGMDRGVFMEYYKTAGGNAFMGWDNSTGNMIIASNVSFASNNVVSVTTWGTLQIGNIDGINLNASGNITAAGLMSANNGQFGNITVTNNANVANLYSTNLIQGATITASGNITGQNILSNSLVQGVTVSATGNLNGNNAVITNNVSAATISATGNVLAGNLNSNAAVTGVTITASGNLVGGNANITNAVNTATVSATGNVLAGNLNSNAAVTGVTFTASGNISANNLSVTNYANSANFAATTGVTTPNLTSTAGLSITTASNGNITLDPNGTGNVILNDQTANRMLYTGSNKEVLTNANATFNGSDLVIIGSAQVDNVIVNGSDITVNTSALTVNSAGADIDFKVSGDTVANLLVVDAGTDTVLINTGTPVTNAKFVISATNSMLIPVGNTVQRPGTGVTGMLRFNTTTNSLEFYDASTWQSAGTTFTVVRDDQFTGNGVQTSFTLSQDSTTAATIVSINGVVQIPTTAYSVSGANLVFTEAPLSTDVIDARSLTTSTIVAGIQNGSGNAVLQGSTTAASFDVTGNLIPTANVTYDLGSTTNRWKDLYLSGSSLTLGNVVIKNTSGNTIAFYGADGTTPATIGTATIANGTSNISIPAASGNVNISSAGTANVLIIDNAGIHVNGNIECTGNITAPQILSITSPLLYLDNEGSGYPYDYSIGMFSNFIGGVGNTYQHTGIIRDYTDNTWKFASNCAEPTGNVFSFTNAIYDAVKMGQIQINTSANATAIVNNGGNGVGNIGSSSAYFNTVFAKATSAQYADLAENYTADAEIEPGTVVVFGGDQEVTTCTIDGSTRVAGVVSTNPSYIMNSGLESAHVATIALTGRVPTKVVGQVRKGDMMVATSDGRARAEENPRIGSVIGKALENFNGDTGVIEVVIGRL